MWTAQGAFFARTCKLYAKARGVEASEATSKLAAYFSVRRCTEGPGDTNSCALCLQTIYVGGEVLLKFGSSGLQSLGKSTTTVSPARQRCDGSGLPSPRGLLCTTPSGVCDLHHRRHRLCRSDAVRARRAGRRVPRQHAVPTRGGPGRTPPRARVPQMPPAGSEDDLGSDRSNSTRTVPNPAFGSRRWLSPCSFPASACLLSECGGVRAADPCNQAVARRAQNAAADCAQHGLWIHGGLSQLLRSPGPAAVAVAALRRPDSARLCAPQ